MMHTMKDGKKIALADMGDEHLLNTIRMMQRKAKAGLIVWSGGFLMGDNEPWFDENIMYGEEAYAIMRTSEYEAEAARRGLAVVNELKVTQ